MATADLLLNILAVDKASATLGGVGKSMSDLESRTKKLGDAGRVLGAGAIIAFGAASLKAYADAERSQVKLQEAYRKFPAIADVSIQSMRDLNSAIQAKTGTDDDELAAAEAKLAMYNLTGSQIRDLIPLVNDYAVAQGINVTDAAGKVGKALMGNTRALKDLGIDYKVTGDKAKDLQNIMGLLEQKVGGAGDAFGQTAAGQMMILQASFSDLQEEVGAQLVPALQTFVSVAKPVLGFFGSLPQPLKSVTVLLGGVAAATLVLGPRIITLGTALTGLLPASAAASTGLAAEATAANGAAVANQAASTSVRALMLSFAPIVAAATAAVAVVVALGEANKYLQDSMGNGAKTSEAYASATRLTAKEVIQLRTDLIQVAGQSGVVSAAMKGMNGDLIGAWTAFRTGGDNVAHFDKALADLVAAGDTEKAAALVASLGLSTEEAKAKLPEYTRALGETTKFTGDYAVVLDDAGDSSLSFMDAVGKMADKERTAFDITKELAQAASDLKTALDELGGKAISVDGATSGLQQAYDDAAEAAKKLGEETDRAKDAVIGNGTALDLSTEAGRTAQGALEGIATKADTLATAMDAAGASTSSIKDAMGDARAEFVQNAIDMGLNETAANALADSYGLIPDDIATEVQLKKDAEAKAKAEEVRRTIGLIPEERRTVTVLPTADSAVAAAERVRGAIVSIPRTWSTTVVIKDQNGNNIRQPLGVATGGYVRGAGTGTSDSIPARLSNGEYVIRASSVSRAGVALLDDLNDNGVIDNVAITAGSRSVVTSARDRAQAQSAEFWSHTVLQVDGKQLAESLVKYKRSIGNRPLGVS